MYGWIIGEEIEDPDLLVLEFESCRISSRHGESTPHGNCGRGSRYLTSLHLFLLLCFLILFLEGRLQSCNMRSRSPLLVLALATGSSAATCSSAAFEKAPPEVFGAEILDISAKEVKGWNEYATSAPTLPALPAEVKPIDFCDVTVIYHHPGEIAHGRLLARWS